MFSINLQASKFMTSSSTLSYIRKYMLWCFSWILFSINIKLDEILVSLTANISNSFLFWFCRLRPRSRLFLSFQPVLFTQQAIIMSFKFFILLEVCPVALKFININYQKWTDVMILTFFENHKRVWNNFTGFKTELKIC